MVASIERCDVNWDGYVLDGAGFPDAIADLKESIRFLKANCETYGVEPGRIDIMSNIRGTRSTLMVALTYDDTGHIVAEYQEQSSQVHAVIDPFIVFQNVKILVVGPLWIALHMHKVGLTKPIEMLRQFGPDQTDYDRLLVEASPITYNFI